MCFEYTTYVVEWMSEINCHLRELYVESKLSVNKAWKC